MSKVLFVSSQIVALALCITMLGQAPNGGNATKMVPVKDQVDIELLTWNEIYDKIHNEGKTTVIIANGGTEQRGPQDVLGGHTIMGHNKGVAVAKALGNALCAPTIPFSIASGDMVHPGGSGYSSDLFKAVNVAEIENMAKNGFKYIFVMGDHGGGQAEMKEAAEYEEKKLGPTGVHVAYISDFYSKSHDTFSLYSYEHKIPIESHAGVMDTAELLWEEPVAGMYVRNSGPNGYKSVPFDPGPEAEAWKKGYDAKIAAAPAPAQRGAATPRAMSSDPVWIAIQEAPAAAGRGGAAAGGEGGGGARGAGANRVNNGITGDPHMATKELGKMYVAMVVTNATNEIHKAMATFPKSASGN